MKGVCTDLISCEWGCPCNHTLVRRTDGMGWPREARARKSSGHWRVYQRPRSSTCSAASPRVASRNMSLATVVMKSPYGIRKDTLVTLSVISWEHPRYKAPATGHKLQVHVREAVIRRKLLSHAVSSHKSEL